MIFSEKRMYNYAKVLLWGLRTARGSDLKKDDIVLIRFDLSGIRIVEILEKMLIKDGIYPVRKINPTSKMEYNFFTYSTERQLKFNIPGEVELYNKLNGSIFIHAPESLVHLSSIDPEKIGIFALSKKKLKNILDKREEKGVFGWTLCTLPTLELAKHAKLTFNEYSKQIVKACFLDENDPIKKWEEIFKKADDIKKWLNSIKIKYFHIKSRSIDLMVTPGKYRRWIGVSGHNIPSFELYISPDWRGTNGVYASNLPSYRNGNYIQDVKLEFKNGNVINAKAKAGEKFLKKQLSTDKGASRLGEFALTDKRFSKINCFMANTLFDENYGGEFGSCHIAIGTSYADSYDGSMGVLSDKNKKNLGFNDSSIHWDLVNTEKKTVTVCTLDNDVITIYQNGEFVF